MKERKKLAIFDLDGTLFDTKNVNFTAYTQALADCGIQVEVDYQYYCNFCNGNSYKVFLPKIVPEISEEQLRDVHERKKALYKDHLGLAKINRHLFCIIDTIRTDYQIALATTASRKNAVDILTEFSVIDKFDIIITQEDVRNIKPNPECYLKAADKAHVSIFQTIIFEDSEVGLRAAKASGASYVKVYGYN